MPNIPQRWLTRQASLICFVFCIGMIAGCLPKVANKPPAEYVNRNLTITGDFYHEDRATRKRTDSSIKQTDDEELSYSIVSRGSPADKFQVYTIGELNLVFFPTYDEDDKKRKDIRGYSVGKLQVTETQITVKFLDSQFFENNPAALPSTVLTKEHPMTLVTLNATPEQLVLFFKLHQDTSDLFNSDVSLALNRTK